MTIARTSVTSAVAFLSARFPTRCISPSNHHLRRLQFDDGSQLRKFSSSRDSRIMSSFYDLKADLPGGGVYDFEELKGQVVLIVNVASKCGFTKQYQGLQALYSAYKDKNFVVLGFPCNQFGGQEPGTDEEVLDFCTSKYNVTFPLVKKSDVNGENANPVFQYLKSQHSGDISWNFAKFLVDKEGNVVQRYAPKTKPEDIADDIEKLL